MSHVTRMNESCHTNEWVMSHMSMSHTHSFMCDMTHWYTWLNYTHSWLIILTHLTRYPHYHPFVFVCHDSFVTHNTDTRDSIILIRDSTHDSLHSLPFIRVCVSCVSWLIRDSEYWHTWLDISIRIHSCSCVMYTYISHTWLKHVTHIIWMSHVAHTNETCHTYHMNE